MRTSARQNRFETAFNKDAYTDVCQHVRDLNNFLANTTQASLRMEGKRRKGNVSIKHAARVRQLRQQARNIHKHIVASKTCWICACKHKVMLRMQFGGKGNQLSRYVRPLRVKGPVLQKWHMSELCPGETGQNDNNVAVLINVSINKSGQKQKKKKKRSRSSF